jgi:hypothetical protein
VTKEPIIGHRIQAVGRTRLTAAAALSKSLEGIGAELSESTIHERWRRALAADSALMPQGWYLPPPAGISVLIGDPPHYTRTSFASLRDRSRWPDQQAGLREECLLFVYASPVDRRTAMIGDFQMTLYAGSDPAIRSHIATCFQITASIVSHATVGMEMRELYDYADRLIREFGLSNSTYSTTNTSGQPNIGHTIPWTYDGYDERIWAAVRQNDGRRIANLMSQARAFVTADETLRIPDNIAFTIEPQIISTHQPKVSFHVIVAFNDGFKRVYAHYAEQLTQFGMLDYLPSESARALSDRDIPG